MDHVVDGCKQGRLLTQMLIELTQKAQNEAVKIENRLDAIRKQLSQAEKLHPDKLFELGKEQQVLSMNLRHVRERSQTELTMSAQRYKDQVLEQAQPSIEKVAQAKNADMVLHLPNPQIIYAKVDLDITEDVIKELEKQK